MRGKEGESQEGVVAPLSLLPASKLLPTLLPPHSSLQNTTHQCNANEGFNNSCPHTSWSCSPKINNLFEK